MALRRNGGHINPPLYTEYKQLKEVYGGPMAKKIIKFRMDHFSELKAVSEEEGILHYTQCREVEHCDVYYDQELFTSAKEKYEIYKTDLPEEAAEYQLHESKEAIKVSRSIFSLSFVPRLIDSNRGFISRPMSQAACPLEVAPSIHTAL